MGGTFESLKGGGAAIALDEIEISILRPWPSSCWS